MAETFLFNIADSLLGKLASYAFEQASRAYDVYDDLQGIKDTLSIVRGVLLDAEYKKDRQHGLREWLRQIQKICSDAEDVLDEFRLQVNLKQSVEDSGSTRKKVRHYISSSSPPAFRFRMARQIKYIRGRLNKAADERTGFGLVKISVEPGLPVQRREMTHSYIDALDVIGRENDMEAIIKLLMQPHPQGDGGGNRSLCVVPIVGIGGLGKTTLAKLVFNDQMMDKLFRLKMWVCVSDDFDLKKILIKVINSASAASTSTVENINHYDVDQLQSHLRSNLSGKKFLLVLDDIWNEDRVKWNALKDLLNVGTEGSKIMATTRNNTIASMMATGRSYVLKGLSPEACLSLFVKWAFKEGEGKKYPNLVEIGKEIVKKCAGVPLAVRTLGSSLFSNFDLHRWEFVRDHGLWNLRMNEDDVLPALQLSYVQMPSHLKQCFSFFSLYPKGFVFNSDEIINLLGALGFIQPQNGSEKIERIVRKCMDELNSRSFLEDFKDYGYCYKFKVHDLIHDLAIYFAREDLVMVNSNTQNIPEQARHLSFLENVSPDQSLFPESKRVRTILYPVQGVGLQSENLLNTWVLRYKYLLYLDLSNSSFETLPNSVAKLKHLCVLYIRDNHRIKRLPRSICKLQSLQVLSLTGCMELEKLPEGFEKLTSLRQLYITTKQSVLSLDEFASLSRLQTLGLYHCDKMELMFSGKQAQLTSLEALYIQSCKSLNSLPLHIFPKLQSLLVEDCNLSLNNEGPIQRLRMKHLHLKRFPKLLKLPRWIEDTVDTLETLKIRKFANLKMLPECLTSMTHLKSLYIDLCPQLLSLPRDMHRLTALKEFCVYRSPELCRKCRPRSGEFWPMIGHIKRVSIGKY